MYIIEKINDQISLGTLDMPAFKVEENTEVKRELERKGIQFLLNRMFEGDPVNLMYLPTNKPYLEGRKEHISISHSHDKLVILVNGKENTGVDIELIREKIVNIKHKYLSENELKCFSNDIETLTVLWAAKEALYKVYGLKEVDFIKHLFIEEFKADENNFYGRIELPNFKKRYLLSKRKEGNYILVYLLSEV